MLKQVVVGTAVWLASTLAWADQGFAPIPAEQTGGQATGLEMRIVKYEGGTNGVISVDVRNPKNQPVEFSAKGLYFVPDANANAAPQRLGAVGPFQVKAGADWQRKEQMTIAAGQTVELKLDVYCIDSHRSSPSSGTKFHVAKSRVPAQLVEEIHKEAGKAADAYGGVAAPAAKGAVQSEVWRARDKKWIKLDGEGKQESRK